MKIKSSSVRAIRQRLRGFTFVEVMVCAAITGVMFITFYAAMASGVRTIQIARENLRATEIMDGYMEGLRLLNWTTQLNSTYLPASFTNSSTPGTVYTGTTSIAPIAWGTPTSYSPKMQQVTVTLNWTSWGVTRTRTMTTYVARYGVQPYVITAN